MPSNPHGVHHDASCAERSWDRKKRVAWCVNRLKTSWCATHLKTKLCPNPYCPSYYRHMKNEWTFGREDDCEHKERWRKAAQDGTHQQTSWKQPYPSSLAPSVHKKTANFLSIRVTPNVIKKKQRIICMWDHWRCTHWPLPFDKCSVTWAANVEWTRIVLMQENREEVVK